MRSSEHFGPCFIAITVTNGLLDNQNCSYIVNIRHNELEIEIEIYLGCASASIFMVIGYLREVLMGEGNPQPPLC